MQRDTSGLTAENKELKLKLQAMEQQTHLRDGKHFYHLLSRLSALMADVSIFFCVQRS